MTIKKILKTIFAYAVALTMWFVIVFVVLTLIGVSRKVAIQTGVVGVITYPLTTFTLNWLSKHTKWYNKHVHD